MYHVTAWSPGESSALAQHFEEVSGSECVCILHFLAPFFSIELSRFITSIVLTAGALALIAIEDKG